MVTQCSQSVVCVIILLIDSQTLLSVKSNHKNRTSGLPSPAHLASTNPHHSNFTTLEQFCNENYFPNITFHFNTLNIPSNLDEKLCSLSHDNTIF